MTLGTRSTRSSRQFAAPRRRFRSEDDAGYLGDAPILLNLPSLCGIPDLDGEEELLVSQLPVAGRSQLKEAPLDSRSYVRNNGAWSVWDESLSTLPVGSLISWSGDAASVPSGWVLADGSAISRAQYPDLNTLYNAAGYPYGSGDGINTFNVPDLRGRVSLGVGTGELPWAATRVVNALQKILDDPRGRWVLTDHPQARSELAVTVSTGAGLEHLRLDRTFVDNQGVRWIIDFKTSAHEGGATEEFLGSEVERYRPQLERYALAMSKLEERPVRVGLYFPLLQAFEDWAPELHS